MAMGQGQIFTTLQKDETHEFINNNDSAGNQNHSQEHDKYEVKPLCNFVRDVTKEELPAYLVPDDVLSRPWAKQLPVVTAQDKATYCFTAAYGRIYHKATGSFLLIDPPDRPACADVPIERCDDMSQLYSVYYNMIGLRGRNLGLTFAELEIVDLVPSNLNIEAIQLMHTQSMYVHVVLWWQYLAET
eukprot:15360906-Ditylum_brightwellii.AAC.1